MKPIRLKVLSPERDLLDREVEQVELPGLAGRFVILPDHAPIISALGPGVIRYRVGGQEETIALSSGFVRVQDNVVTVCVEL